MKGKVFISSTCYDLIDLRAELKEFIWSIGLIPIMSDQPETHFETYTDQNSIETCLINLRNCEVVIVILSQRYGPSLEKAGFENLSATHLEYKTAMDADIRTILFVRDKLEADYIIYTKTGDPKSVKWIDKENGLPLFEILENHKKLRNTKRNNWYWPFKSSLDIKERLKIDLKPEIDANRINNLVRTGNVALLLIHAVGAKFYPHMCTITLMIKNFGNQAAINPEVKLYRETDYEKITKAHVPIATRSVRSLESNELSSEVYLQFNLAPNSKNEDYDTLTCEIVYTTVYGDHLADISLFTINPQGNQPKYSHKKYLNGNSFKILIEE